MNKTFIYFVSIFYFCLLLGEKILMEKPRDNLIKNFALSDDSLFINALVTRIAKEKEVMFRTFSGEEHIGFITGLDHEWVQLTTTEDCAFDMIQIVNIESFSETKRSLRSKDLGIPELQRDRIREFANIIYKKARNIYMNRPSRTPGFYRNDAIDDEEDYEVAAS